MTQKVNFKLTVVARAGALGVSVIDPISDLKEIITTVLEKEKLEAQSYKDYENDITEIATLYTLGVEETKELKTLIPEITR